MLFPPLSPPSRWAARAVVCLALFAALPAAATTLRQLDEDELTARSVLILRGSCSVTETQRLGNRLITLVRLRVDEVHKGADVAGRGGDEITVVLPGGVDLDAPRPVSETWPGVPVLVPGDDLLLFLRPYASLAGTWTPVGLSQGIYSLHAGAGGSLRASRDLSGATLLDGGGRATAGGRQAEPLDALLERLDAHLASGTEEVR